MDPALETYFPEQINKNSKKIENWMFGFKMAAKKFEILIFTTSTFPPKMGKSFCPLQFKMHNYKYIERKMLCLLLLQHSLPP